MSLIGSILERVYQEEGVDLDALLKELRGVDWSTLTSGLSFYEVNTGGGVQMMVADSPYNLQIVITDGEEGTPVDAGNFALQIHDNDMVPFEIRIEEESG